MLSECDTSFSMRRLCGSVALCFPSCFPLPFHSHRPLRPPRCPRPRLSRSPLVQPRRRHQVRPTQTFCPKSGQWPVVSQGRARYPRGSMSTKPSAPLPQQRDSASTIASKSAWANGPPRSTSTLTAPSSLPTSTAVSSSPTESFHASSLQALPPSPVTHSSQPQPAKSSKDQSFRRTASVACPTLPDATLSRHSCKFTFHVCRSAPHVRYSCGTHIDADPPILSGP